jgi:DNA repair exonuclease SbcCD ATPase subunit
MEIQSIKIEDFKGINSFAMDFQQGESFVYGANASGKTTIFDAYCWLLFNKDSLGATVFEVKPHGADFSAKGAFSAVRMVCLVDGELITLKKVYKEKWVKRRGAASRTYSGNTTDYFVNGVPKKLKQYQENVASICDESKFRLLTSPRYFCEEMHWQDRRQILLDLCPDITDEQVIKSDKRFAELPELLGKHSIDDFRKIITSTRRKINEELKSIPDRIDEASKRLADVKPHTAESIEVDIEALAAESHQLQQKISQILTGGETAILSNEMSEVEGRILTIRNTMTRAFGEKMAALESKYNDEMRQKDKHERELDHISAKKSDAQKSLDDIIASLSQLREAWEAKHAEKFTAPAATDTHCYACGQPLPVNKIKAAADAAREKFNEERAAALESMAQKGQALKSQESDLRERIEFHKSNIASMEKTLADQNKAVDAAKKAMDSVDPVHEPPELAELMKRRTELEEKLAAVNDGNKGSIEPLQAAQKELNAQKSKLNDIASQIKMNAQVKERMDELADREKQLAAEFEETERQLNLLDDFVRARVNLLEESINTLFKFCSFRLFEEQVNGGITETCTVTVNDVGYGSINNAARIQAGVEIINVLSAHYGATMPVWIDNRESVTELPDISGQLISLVVSPEDKTLRIE